MNNEDFSINNEREDENSKYQQQHSNEKRLTEEEVEGINKIVFNRKQEKKHEVLNSGSTKDLESIIKEKNFSKEFKDKRNYVEKAKDYLGNIKRKIQGEEQIIKTGVYQAANEEIKTLNKDVKIYDLQIEKNYEYLKTLKNKYQTVFAKQEETIDKIALKEKELLEDEKIFNSNVIELFEEYFDGEIDKSVLKYNGIETDIETIQIYREVYNKRSTLKNELAMNEQILEQINYSLEDMEDQQTIIKEATTKIELEKINTQTKIQNLEYYRETNKTKPLEYYLAKNAKNNNKANTKINAMQDKKEYLMKTYKQGTKKAGSTSEQNKQYRWKMKNRTRF